VPIGYVFTVALLAWCTFHRRRVLPHARGPNQARRWRSKTLINPRGGDFYLATSGDHNLAVDTQRQQRLNHRPLVVREITPSHPACLPPRIQPGQQNVQTPNSVND
jgi:hypothetical protein